MSSTTGFVFKNETPLVENVTGYPLTTEFYPYTTTTTTGPMVKTTTVGCGVTGVSTGVVVPPTTTTTTVVETGVTGPITGCGLPYNTYKYVVDLVNTAEDAYLTGHQIDGRILYPTTGYLYLVWKSLAKFNGFTSVEQMPISFENVEIHRATILALKQQLPGKQIEFCVRIVPKTGLFELVEGENIIMTGRVAVHESIAKLEQLKMLMQQHLTHLNERRRVVDLLEQEEIYRELRMRGYEYNGEFMPLLRADLEGTCGELLWTGKWIPFLDAMLQLNTLSQQRRLTTGGLLLPTRIRSIKIDPFAHFHMQKMLTKMVAKSMSVPSFRSTGLVERPYVLPVVFDPITSRVVCGGVEIVGINTVCTGIQNWYPTSPMMTNVSSPMIGSGLVNNFVPYMEKHFDEEYVVVDKCGGVEGVEPVSTQYRQNREFLEFYLGECRRYISHILRKIEEPTVVLPTVVPTVVPKTIIEQLECLKLVPTTTTTTVVPTIEREFYSTPYGKLLESGKLLQLLVQVANIESVDGQYLYKIQKIFNEKFAYLRALEEDCILNLINNRSYYLKSILDTVLENTHHIYSLVGGSTTGVVRGVVPETYVPKLRVLEISPSVGHFFGAKVSNLMRLYPSRHIGQVEYHYVPSMVGVHPSTVVPEEYICELNKKLPYEIKKVEWNFGLKSGQLITEVPSHLREYDLVILNGGLSSMLPYVESEFELKKWLQTVIMEKIMKPQGFLFVHEYTNSFDLLSQLNKLEHLIAYNTVTGGIMTPFKFTTGRFPYSKYLGESQWRQIIEECGFYPVSMKSDVELSSMFLYRRPLNWTVPTGTGLVEEKIFIDECIESPVELIKRVRVALLEKQIERLWLLSEREPTVEIVSIINSLRRELGGEKIRCLFVADRQPLNIYGERLVMPTSSIVELVRTPFVQSQWKELFGVVRKADLVMNVLRQGQWGSFRPIVNVRGLYPITPYTSSTVGREYTPYMHYPFVSGSTYPVPPLSYVRYPLVPTTVGCGYPVIMTHLPVGCPFEYPIVGGETVVPTTTGTTVTTTGTTTTVVPTVYETGLIGGEYPLTKSVMYRGTTRSPFVVGGINSTLPSSRVLLNPLQTYIITCGLGSFGLELLEWAIEHGARRVIVTSKYGVRTGYQARKLRILRDEYAALIQVLQVDVREEVECLSLIKEAIQMSVEKKIGGIFHLGSCVEDMFFEQQYPVSQVHEVLRKITEYRCQGAINLDKLTRAEGIMDETGYFVVFSPVLSTPTMPTLLEKICESRRRIGRHGIAFHWGCNVETGLLVEKMFAHDITEPFCTVPERIFTCLKLFETILLKSYEPTMWSHYVPVEKYWSPEFTTGVYQPTYVSPINVPTYKSIVEVLLTVLGVKEMSRLVGCESMITLGELGLDTVLAVELKQLFEQIYNLPLTVRDIQMLTLEKMRLIESRYPQGIYELYQPRPLTWLPRLRSVIVPKTLF